ncbi:hypothetical protein BP6252_01239 [Coleophoma cylindrospora]|uniref:DUF2231 domain-containing protein n=1 Tax=Coleophoma cylindrospora TaxID=1849047 RepID=A0A3D8SSD2_9HELO|nr:hypothetical protein BP6252_01239 [Coleophoma cylindrospora]
MSLPKRVYEAIGLGKVGDNSHPIHPATIHFPIAFLTLANGARLVYGSALNFNIPFSADSRNLFTIASISYASNILGLVTVIPALLTGFAEAYAMISANGLYMTTSNGEKQMIPKVKTTLLHAGINDLAVGIAAYNWLKERNAVDFRPEAHQVGLSAIALMATFYAAFLGGSLIYTHGVGVQRQGKGLEEKTKKMAEIKKSM